MQLTLWTYEGPPHVGAMRIATQIAGLKGGVGDGWALWQPFNHRNQQVGVGVALRCMQHVKHVLHRGGDAHRAHMWRAFVCPKR